MEKGLNIQIPLMANRFRKGEIRVETLTRSGEWFRENFPVTPPTAVTALTDYREKDRKTVWYNSRYYRTNLLWEGGTLCIRDIHMFDQRMESDYYRKAGTTNQCVYTTLPVVDGCMWSTREQLAGLRVMRRTADGSLAPAQGGTPAVTEKGKGKLLVEWPMDDGRQLTILLSEEGMEIAAPGKGPDARHAVQQVDGRNAVDVDGQRMGLVPGAGIGEVDAIEKYHGLVERAPTDEDVGLHALAPAFADIDRRCEAQGGLQGLDGRCGLCFPVEKRGLRLYVARRGGLAARNADLVDPQRFEDGGRIGIVRRRMLRREQEDRHRHGEDSDGYMAVQARKGCPALAAPTPEAGSLLGSDVFHLEFVGLIIKKNRSSR